VTFPDANPPASGPADALSGTLVGDRYRLLERIGVGGMGTVYRAEHIHMKKAVAIKLLHPELGRHEEIVRRFEREAQSASRLSHPHIIQVTDFGRTTDGVLFLVMELLQGESLAAAIRASGRLPVPRAVEIARQILSALEHAHAEGVVHRDLKPENIMLVARATLPPVDFIKILDFGIAKMSDDAPTGGAQPLTQAGVVFGTPDYMSPEQAMGDRIDARSDLYSLGVILFEMVTGSKPFVGKSHVEVISMHLTREPPLLRQVAPNAGIPGVLENLVRRALVKKRDDRIRSATEFASALAVLGDTGPVAAPRPGGTATASDRVLIAWRGLPEQVRRLVPVGVAVVLALSLGIASLVRLGRGPSSAPPPVRPVEPRLLAPIKLAEQALGRGELVKARTILTQQLSEHPESARVHYLLGNIDFIEHKPETGLESYREAIRRDTGYRGDAALLRNVRELLDDKKLAGEALELLVHSVGRPAGDALAEVASSERRAELRHLAQKACLDLACDDRVDHVQSFLLDLSQGRSCEERREAVGRLARLGDVRALDPLRRARRRGGGLFGLFGGGNECIRKDLDDAIKALEARR
jgi:serine/threonine-protein kinase